MKKFYLAGLTGLSVLGISAFAEEPNPLAAIYACAEIPDDTARLACFDQSVNQTRTAQQSGEFRTLTRQDSQRVQEDAFGFSLPSLPVLNFPSIGSNNDLADAVDEPAPVQQAEAPEPPEEPPVATAEVTPPDAPIQTAPEAPVERPVEAPVQTAEITPPPAPPDPQEEPEAPAAEADEDPGRAMDVIRDEDGDVESVTLAIRRINRSPYGKITVYFRNGQVWRQVDSDEVRISRINPPRTATIRRAAFGSYLMRLNNEGRAIRVRREE